ncbi:TadE/TadG family type IV pilus assembly protein [Sphingomonas sp. R86521]|uniref:TadE/TadG family type IV pilus assembly protein n=1 Tax=Sphingomonas sp. R86521 TaxID=3093860 RepID=UPI0036D38041
MTFSAGRWRSGLPLMGLRRNQCGATAVEFALILLPMMIVILAFLDFGHTLYVDSMLQGSVQDAARQATIGDRTDAQIDQIIYNGMTPLISADKISIVRKSYRQFSGVGKPETLVDDKNGNGVYDPGDCWIDTNPNGTFDTDAGQAGMGDADDVLFFEVTIRYDRITPMSRLLGWPNTVTRQIRTMMRNQPYAGRGSPAKVCG